VGIKSIFRRSLAKGARGDGILTAVAKITEFIDLNFHPSCRNLVSGFGVQLPARLPSLPDTRNLALDTPKSGHYQWIFC
jgi:hypothetical protein